jgi:hypothetical protein
MDPARARHPELGNPPDAWGRAPPYIASWATGGSMPRYLIERTFIEGLFVPPGQPGRKLLQSIMACNSDRNVTWIHSYVAIDAAKSFCIYEAPSPEAIRLAAASNNLPVDRITQISVLDPYAYHVS